MGQGNGIWADVWMDVWMDVWGIFGREFALTALTAFGIWHLEREREREREKQGRIYPVL
jgi:hypothetical protein